MSGGTLNFGGSSDGVLITVDATAITTTIASPITAANGLTIAGFSGTTSDNTNALDERQRQSGHQTGPITLDGGTLNFAGSGDLGTGTLNLVGGTLTASAAATLGNSFTLSNNLLNVSNVVTIGGSNAITFLGGGTLKRRYDADSFQRRDLRRTHRRVAPRVGRLADAPGAGTTTLTMWPAPSRAG